MQDFADQASERPLIFIGSALQALPQFRLKPDCNLFEFVRHANALRVYREHQSVFIAQQRTTAQIDRASNSARFRRHHRPQFSQRPRILKMDAAKILKVRAASFSEEAALCWRIR
jgi:hypothetical protein